MTFGAFMMIIRSSYYPFLKTYFEMPVFRKQISTGTSTINQITGKMLNDISIPVPELKAVERFKLLVDQADKSKIIDFKVKGIYLDGLSGAWEDVKEY